MKFEYSFKIFWILNFWSYRLRIWSDWADDPNKAHWHWCIWSRTTDTQWNHNSKFFENFSRFGRQNILQLYLKIWDWHLIFGPAVKAISSLGVRNPWPLGYNKFEFYSICWFIDLIYSFPRILNLWFYPWKFLLQRRRQKTIDILFI